MGFNLNRTQSPDYQLKGRMIHEMIGIYGVVCDYLFVTKMNKDNVLKDFSHLEKSGDSKKITLLPEETAAWEGDLAWDMFGLNNLRTINFFVSAQSLKDLYDDFDGLNTAKEIINSLIVLPSGTIIEITDMKDNPETGDNLFTYADAKNVFLLSTRVYSNSQQNEIEIESTGKPKTTKDSTKSPENDFIEYSDTEIQAESFDDLDEYFKSLDENKSDTDIKGISIGNSDSVFGSLG